MKAILEFNLPEDEENYEMAVNALSYYCALVGIKDFLRKRLKYDENSDEVFDALEAVQTRFFEILTERNINL